MRKLALLILVAAIIFVKFWRADELFLWHADQDIDALIAKKIVIDWSVPLLGFPVPGGIFIGPLARWLLAPFYLAADFNPNLIALVAAALGLATVCLVYIVGKTIFESRRIALLATIVFGLSFLTNIYSKLLTILLFVPILALLSYLFIYWFLKTKKVGNLWWLAGVLGLALQTEGSSFSLVALAFIVFVIFRPKISRAGILQMAVIVFLLHLPLIYYDLTHNFYAAKSSLLFFLQRETIYKDVGDVVVSPISIVGNSLLIFPQTFARLLFISGENDIASQLMGCGDLVLQRLGALPIASMLIAALILAGFVLLTLFSRRAPLGAKIVLIHLSVMFLGLIGYNLFVPNYFNEWTLAIFFPGFALVAAYFLKFLASGRVLKLVVVGFLVTFVFVNLRANEVAVNSFGLSQKTEAVKYALSQVDGRPFYLESLGSCFAHGYIYLFWYYGQLPVKTFGIGEFFEGDLIPRYSGEVPKLGVVLVNPSQVETGQFWQRYNLKKQQATASMQIGKIEVLLVEDKQERGAD